MDSADILSLLEQLDDEINDLENSLAPLLKPALSETASKLPLLDNAKLYVLVTYALESMIFSYLRLNGVKAREHQVFKELTRVKQYFDKIKNAETPVGNRENIRVDKQAAARFIKAGLAGNDKYDLQRAEQQAKERARSHIRFNELSKKPKATNAGEESKANDSSSDSSQESESESSEQSENIPMASVPPKKRKLEETSLPGDQNDSTPSSGAPRHGPALDKLTTTKGKSKKRSRKRKRDKSTSTSADV